MADEDVTTPADGEDSGAVTKAKKKPPKEPKVPKEVDEPKDKKKKGKKEKGGAGGVILIMVLVLVILIGGYVAALYLDMFSAREIAADAITEPLLNVIIWLDPGYSSIRNRLRAEGEAQEKRFDERARDLDEREANLELLEGVVNTREQLLERRTQELDRREEQIIAMYERTIPIYKREMTEQEHEDMVSLSRTFTQMAPDVAAEILVRLYDPRDVAAILYFMGERNSASILAVMDAAYAAEITEIWLYS